MLMLRVIFKFVLKFGQVGSLVSDWWVFVRLFADINKANVGHWWISSLTLFIIDIFV